MKPKYSIFYCLTILWLGQSSEIHAQWQTSGSNIYYTAGNVGIGTTTPHVFFEVFKSTNYLWTTKIKNTGGSAYGLLIEAGYGGSSSADGIIMQLNDNVGDIKMRVQSNGNVGIGTGTPAHKLDVHGTIRANEILVNSAGADFVFAPDYRLRPLTEVEQFITANKHLPDIAPADSMVQNGVNMGEMQIRLLQKIEELTLYVIKQGKRNKRLEQKLEEQQKEIQEQDVIIKSLTQKRTDHEPTL